MTSIFECLPAALRRAGVIGLMACLVQVALADEPAGGWTEGFDTDAWVERWVPYGRLADGTWAQGIEGHWPKGPQTVFARSEWWGLEDGVIRGRNFPDEKHAAGLSRRDKLPRSLESIGLRIRCRVRIDAAATARIKVGGQSPGVKPDEATDNHVAVVDVRTVGIRFWNGNRVLVAEEPIAPGEPRPKRRFENDVLEKVSERPIAPDEWHEVRFEVRQRDVRVEVDGAEAVACSLPHVQPLQGVSLEVDGDKRTVGTAWFDEVAVEPLAARP